jgi:hypothetical protein
MAVNGKVVAQSPFNNVKMSNGLSLNRSANGDIILAADGTIFKSCDNGQTWKQILKTSNPASDEFKFCSVIAVNQSNKPISVSECEEIYWVLGRGTNDGRKMWEYSVDVSQMKVTKRLEIDTRMQTLDIMAYDGDDSVFAISGSSYSSVSVYSYAT